MNVNACSVASEHIELWQVSAARNLKARAWSFAVVRLFTEPVAS
jgi:hypothetical protein